MATKEQHEELVEALDEDVYLNDCADADTTCTICHAEFLDPDDLSVHVEQIHKITDSNLKSCLFCPQKYTDLTDFAEHFRDNHLTSLFYCLHCLRAFSDDDEWRLHEKKHKRSYKSFYCCAQCNEKFGNIHDLKTHDFDKHFDNNDDGVMIQSYFPYISAVLYVKAETVLLSLRTEAVYICVCCNYSSSNIEVFLDHSRAKKCKIYVCDRCSNVYKKKFTMSKHSVKCLDKFDTYRKIKCPDCNLVFNKYSFSKHKKVCKVIKCHKCETHYDTMYELSEHQSNDHPLSVELQSCTFCGKECVGSLALKKHFERSHKAELPLYKYMCVHCKVPFKHPQKLFGHFFTKHKEIEPYTCKICSKKFRIRKKFTLHIKLEHKSIGFVEFDENYNVYFTEKKSENPFIPKSMYVEEQKEDEDHEKSQQSSNIALLNMNSEMSVTETEGNQTEVELAKKPTLKRKRVIKIHKKVPEETITLQSSDDEPLLVVKKRVQKAMPKPVGNRLKKKQLSAINKNRFTCNICKKYCYTYQNYNHHVSLHSKKDYKKCIKCSKVFRSQDKLKRHINLEHSSSKLTDTLKYMLEKRKTGGSITDDLPISEKFRRTIRRVNNTHEVKTMAKIKKVDNSLSVQKFIENFTPEGENKLEEVINHDVIVKAVKGMRREPTIKMSKFEIKPAPLSTKLSMPVKFKSGNFEKVTTSIRLVQPVKLFNEESQDNDFQNYDDDMDRHDDTDRHDAIPEVALEVMLEGTEETPKTTHIPHKIVIPKLPMEYKDMRIAHLLPQAPYYKIVKVNDVLSMQNNENNVVPAKSNFNTIKLANGTKLVHANPLAHLLGNTSVEQVLEPIKNKYYKYKTRDFQGMLAQALSKLDKPTLNKKKKKDSKVAEPTESDISSQVENK